MKTTTTLPAILLILLLFSGVGAQAANECRIQYGWNTGYTLQNTFQNHSTYLYINESQTLSINKDRMNFVKNVKPNEVEFYLENANNVTLAQNQKNPSVGNYLGQSPVKLLHVKCLSSSNNPSTPEALVQFLKSQNISVNNIASQLESTFNQSKNQISTLLKNSGYNAMQIAGALKNGLNANAGQIAPAIKHSYGSTTPLSMINIIKSLNFSAASIIPAIHSTYNISPNALAQAMKQAGYTSENQMIGIANNLKSTFNTSHAIIVGALEHAGYAHTLILNWLMNSQNLSLNNASVVMKAAGFNANTFANLLRDANHSANATVAILKSTYGLSRNQAEQALQNAGFVANLILTALNQAYGVIMQAGSSVKGSGVGFAVATAERVEISSDALEAAGEELKGWFAYAEIYRSKCKVNGPSATGMPGVFGSSYRWKQLVKRSLKANGLSDAAATHWDNAYKKSFTDWYKGVTIPALPWYPSFAAFPGAKAPAIPNVPISLGMLVSSKQMVMLPENLEKNILKSPVPQSSKGAVTMFSVGLSARFTKFLSTAQVMSVFGEGPIPTFKTGLTPMGPVVGGSCFGEGILSSSLGMF